MLRISITLTALTIALFSLTFGQSVLAEDTAPFSISGSVEVTRISDGDSLRSGKLKIRLFGIDAPEIKQQCQHQDGSSWSCGQAAHEAMQALAKSTPKLDCHLRDVDRYGRLIMQCFAGGTDIAGALVGQGLALAYRDYSTAYVSAEQAAAAARLGMWDGSFTPPWEWRKK